MSRSYRKPVCKLNQVTKLKKEYNRKNRRKQMKWWQKLLIALAFIVIVVGAFISLNFIVIKKNNKNYQEALQNKPDINYIEEDMELYLISTLLYIYDIEYEWDYIIYYVEDLDTHNHYKVLYALESYETMLGVKGWKWRYKSYIRID